MKRLISAILAFCVLAAVSYAQKYGYTDRFKDNWYISGGLGVNALNQDVGVFDSPARFGLDITAGKWFSPMFGARAGWQGTGIATQNLSLGYNYLHGDILWDILGTAEGAAPDRFWRLAPYVNMGLVLCTSDGSLFSKGFGAGPGLLNTFRIARGLDAYIDLRTTMFTERLVGSASGAAMMFSALAGLQYSLGNQGWDDSEADGGRNGRFFDDWFLSAGLGANAVTNARVWTGTFTPTVEIAVGKWFSPYAGARLGVQGLDIMEPAGDEKFRYAYVHADAMWNFTNTVLRRKTGHIWNAVPYAHIGVINSFHRGGGLFKREFAAGAGLYNAFPLNSHVDFYADFRAALLNGRSAGKKAGALLQPSILAGFAYNIGGSRWMGRDGRPHEGYQKEEDYVPQGPLQYNGFFGNWSVYAAGGVTGFLKQIRGLDVESIRPAFELGLAKGFSPSFGGRLGLHHSSLRTDAATYGWNYVHGDILWDIKGTFRKYDPDRIWSIAPYMAMGASFVTRAGRTSSNFASGPGLLNSFRFNDWMGAFVDLRGVLLSERQFGSSGGYVLNASAMAGLTLNIGKPRWDDRGTGIFLNGFGENWFVQTTGGFGLVLDTRQRFNGRPGPAIDIAVGKWFSPEWGARIGYLFENFVKDDNSEFDSGYVHADVLWNMSNAIGGYKADRVYTISPYLNFGVTNVRNHFSGRLGKDFSAGAGLLNDFKVDDRMSFIIDLRARAVTGRLTGKGSGRALAGEALFGLSCNLARGGWRPERDNEDLRGPWAISTNLLSLVDLATLNLGLEYAVGRHCSLDMQMEYNGWNFNHRDRKRSFSVGARYWPWYVYSGVWVRGFAGAEDCDAENLPLKYLNGTSDRFGAGLSAGYSLMLAKHFNLDFGLGFWGGVRHSYQGAWNGFIAPKDIRISLMFVL